MIVVGEAGTGVSASPTRSATSSRPPAGGAAGLRPHPGRDPARPRRRRPRSAARGGRRRERPDAGRGPPRRRRRRAARLRAGARRAARRGQRRAAARGHARRRRHRRPRSLRGRALPRPGHRRPAGAVAAHRDRVPAAFAAAVGTSDVVSLRVGPLTAPAVADLLDALLPGALTTSPARPAGPPRRGQRPVRHGDRPRARRRRRGGRGRAGRWVVVGDADDVAMPGSVAELVEARIDQLPTQARITLQDASVIGQRFSERLLEQRRHDPDGGRRRPRRAGRRRAGAAATDRAADPHDDLWSFRSRLVREVAYDSILRRRRPPAHRAVADALLDLEPERVAENADLLAHHLEEGDDPPAAIPHLLVAIDRAECAYNFTGALERARAGSPPPRPVPRPGGRPRRGVAAPAGRDHEAGARRRVRPRRAAAGRRPPRRGGHAGRGRCRCTSGSGWYLTVSGERARAVPHLQAAQALAESSPRRAAPGGRHRRRRHVAVPSPSRPPATCSPCSRRGGGRRGRRPGRRRHLHRGAGAARGRGVPALGRRCRSRRSSGCGRRSSCRGRHVFGTLADRCGRWLVLALVDAGRFDEALELAEPLLARVRRPRRSERRLRGARRPRPPVAPGRRRRPGPSQLASEAVATAAERAVAPDAAAEAHLLLAHLALDRSARCGAAVDAEAARVARPRRPPSCTPLGRRRRRRVADVAVAARAALVRGRLAVLRGDLDRAIECAAESARRARAHGRPARAAGRRPARGRGAGRPRRGRGRRAAARRPDRGRGARLALPRRHDRRHRRPLAGTWPPRSRPPRTPGGGRPEQLRAFGPRGTVRP